MACLRSSLALATLLAAMPAAAQPDPPAATTPPRRIWRELLHGLRYGPSFEIIEVGGADGRMILIADDAGTIYRTLDAGDTWQESPLTTDEDALVEIPLPRLEEIVPPNVDLFDAKGEARASISLARAARTADRQDREDDDADRSRRQGGSALAPRDRAEDPGDILSHWTSEEGYETFANWMTTCETNDERVYVATDEGLFRSDNAGLTWYRVFIGANDPETHVLTVLCDDEDHESVYIGTRAGFFWSRDGGNSWVRPTSWTGNLSSCYMEHDASVDGRIYVGTYFGAYVTDDLNQFDEVWYPLTGTVDARAICSIVSTEHHLYLGAYDGGVVSHDGGRTFEPLGAGYLDRSTINMMMADPRDGDHIYIVTSQTFWETRDGGRTVTPLLTGQGTADLRTFTLDPNDPERVYLLSGSQLLVLEPDRPQPRPSPRDPVVQAAARALRQTPPLGTVLDATLRRTGLDSATVARRRSAARTRNAWPSVSVVAGIADVSSLRGLLGLGSIGLSDSVYDTPNCRLAIRPPNCWIAARRFDLGTEDRAGLTGWGVGILLRWNLSLFGFDRAESNSIWNDVMEVQQDVMHTVAFYWFERGRVLRELVDRAHTPSGSRALGLRAAETTATLDALSGGALSRSARGDGGDRR